MQGLSRVNELERTIVESEDAAENARWEQAAEIATLSESMSQRKIAAGWMNLRTGQPYTQPHVSNVLRVWSDYRDNHPRPDFREKLNELSHRGAGQDPEDPEDPEDPRSYEEIASTLGIEDAVEMMHAGAQRMNELYAQETPQMRDRRMDMELEATETHPVPETEVIRQRLLPLDTGGIERSYFRGMLEAARLLADVYPQSRDLDLAIEALEAQIAACQSKLHELQQQRRSQRHLSAVEGSD